MPEQTTTPRDEALALLELALRGARRIAEQLDDDELLLQLAQVQLFVRRRRQ